MAKKPRTQTSTPEATAPKEGSVTLLRNDDLHKDQPVQFSVKTAQNLLAMQERKGWKHYSLPKDSKLTFKDGYLIPNASDSADSGAGQ